MTIVDSHQHFWVYTPEEFPWISDEMSELKRDFLPDALAPALKHHAVAGTVVVQALHSLAETRWLLALGERTEFVRGVVGWADLRSPGLRGQLEEFSAHPKFRGVRHLLQDEPDDGFMLEESFQSGLRMLGEFGLTYDLVVRSRHLATASHLAAGHPEQRFVLDHIGKPPIKAGERSPWEADLRELASHPNVFCKVSGMVTEADWQSWETADLRPYLDVVFDAFGPDRLMYGSDWPVCNLAADYGRVFGVVHDYVESLSESEQRAVFGEVAARFYHLDR